LIWHGVFIAFILSVGLGIAAQGPSGSPPPAKPADLKNPKPEIGPDGRPIPNHFTLTICKGTFFDMTPKNGSRDRFQTPHGVKNINKTGTAASGGEHGENGTIRINSGAPGVPGTEGESTIDYDIVD